jgi:hypothetical protein
VYFASLVTILFASELTTLICRVRFSSINNWFYCHNQESLGLDFDHEF